jgi:hypothetical protein
MFKLAVAEFHLLRERKFDQVIEPLDITQLHSGFPELILIEN